MQAPRAASNLSWHTRSLVGQMSETPRRPGRRQKVFPWPRFVLIHVDPLVSECYSMARIYISTHRVEVRRLEGSCLRAVLRGSSRSPLCSSRPHRSTRPPKASTAPSPASSVTARGGVVADTALTLRNIATDQTVATTVSGAEGEYALPQPGARPSTRSRRSRTASSRSSLPDVVVPLSTQVRARRRAAGRRRSRSASRSSAARRCSTPPRRRSTASRPKRCSSCRC